MLRQIANPPNPYERQHREWLEEPPRATMDVYHEQAKSILSENDSPDLPFRWSVNPYRGCQHACAYCYARPYHEYLGMGAGTDFDTKIVVKINAPELLEQAFNRPKWNRECINFCGVTDAYQPFEAVYELTRRCLQVCLDHDNPAVVVTKSFLVARDAELLAQLNERAGARVFLSVPFATADLSRTVEPYAPSPARRFEAIRRLTACGVPTGVLLAPIIPGLNDSEIPAVLQQAAEAGAKSASFVALRLTGSVEHVFLERMRAAMPLRLKRMENRLRDIRHGQLDEKRFGNRMHGEGVYWDSIKKLFEVCATRYGLKPLDRTTGKVTAPAPAPKRAAQLSFSFNHDSALSKRPNWHQ